MRRFRRSRAPRGAGHLRLTLSPSGGLTLTAQFRALFTPGDIWLDADNVTVSGGKIASWINVVDPTNTWAQAAPAAQLLLPAADPALGGAKSAAFTGVEYYISNRTAAAGKYRHDGTGVTEVAVWVPLTTSAGNNIFLAGGNGAAPNAIFYFGGSPATATLRLLLPSNFNSLANPYDNPVNAGTFSTWTYLESAAPKWTLRRKLALTASGSTTTPSAADPPSPTHLGATPVLDSMSIMRLRAVYSWRRVLSAAELAIVEAYIQEAAGIVSFQQVLAASHGKPVFTADRYVEDPAHLGFVLRFVDWNDPTHWLEQTTPAMQVALPLPHVDFGGQLCATFTGAETYVSNRPPSEFRFTSDGTGCSMFRAATPTTVAGVHSCACTTSQAGVRGLSFYLNTNDARSSVEKTGSSVYPDSTIGTFLVDVPMYREISHGTARTPQWELRSTGATVSSGAYTTPAEAGDPMHTLRISSNQGPGLFYVGRWRDLIFTPGVTALERTTIQTYYAQTYGISLFRQVLQLAAGKPVFTADRYVEDPAHPGFVLRFVDWSDPAHWLEQTNPALQVALPQRHADFGGALCVSFTGAQYYLSNRAPAAWNYLHDGTGYTAYMPFTPVAGGAPTQAFFSTVRVQDSTTTVGAWVGLSTGGTLQYSWIVGNGTASRPFDQAVNNIPGFADATPTYLRMSYKELATPEGVLQNKTTPVVGINSASAPSAANASATLTFPANGVTFDGKATMRMRSLVFMPTLTAAEEATVRAWIAADTGIV